MDKTISVIIPVYNVSAYLRACMDSVVNQTYRDLEIILIDDGSTDDSGRICDEYADKDGRITVVHQNNAGAAAAKNAGLRIAAGYYLSFVDSDDFLELDAYSYMTEQMQQYNADVIQCAFRDCFVDHCENHITLEGSNLFQTEEYLLRYTKDWTCGLLWDKLYRRKLFDGIYFEEGHKIDDEFFTYRGMMNAKTILHSPHIIYNYRKRRSGIMHSLSGRQQILTDKIDYLMKRRSDIAMRYPALKAAFDYHYLNMMVILSHDEAASGESIQKIRNSLRKYYRDGNFCRMELSLAAKILRLMILPPSVYAQNRTQAETDKIEHYFD